eukprot:scaffold43363_cov95-Phaeocystis_antarctica.AAC.3
MSQQVSAPLWSHCTVLRREDDSKPSKVGGWRDKRGGSVRALQFEKSHEFRLRGAAETPRLSTQSSHYCMLRVHVSNVQRIAGCLSWFKVLLIKLRALRQRLPFCLASRPQPDALPHGSRCAARLD